MSSDTTARIGSLPGSRTPGMADVEEHWVKAATYGVVCARRADDLLRRDTWTMNVVLGLATVTSLGAFTAVSRNPALWAQLLVALLAGTAAVLTAIRQQNDWARQSGTLRERGVGWNRQRSFAGDLAQRLHDGGTITEKERTRLNDDESRLLDGHPWISSDVYNKVEPDTRSEFRDCYERGSGLPGQVPTLVPRHRTFAPAMKGTAGLASKHREREGPRNEARRPRRKG